MLINNISDENIKRKISKVLTELDSVIENYVNVKTQHDQAEKEYDGHSWDYHGGSYIEEMEKAKDEVKKLFLNASELYAEYKISIKNKI
jgi:hypothetical protein